MFVLNINNFHLGTATSGGHEIYLDALYHPVQENNAAKSQCAKRMIFKKNKYNKPHFSRLEAAFSQLARLFLAPGLTAKQKLVVDNAGTVVGLAAEHLYYGIAEREGLAQPFYSLTADFSCVACTGGRAENIPIYFLNQLPNHFFAQLLAREKKRALIINYASLASILTSSYTLEEDDLHKGNFGFYLVDREGTPEAVFFKIDHDLMFTEQLMSFHSIRLQQIFHNEHDFDIRAEDVLDFPNLHHSANFYWPTKKNILPKPGNVKAYRLKSEIDAFASLNQNPVFNKAKWLAFYKHILIPIEQTEQALAHCLDKNDAQERAQIALMAQAVSARQAQLKAVLFSLPQFRQCIKELSEHEQNTLVREILECCPEPHTAQTAATLQHLLRSYETLSCFEEGDTPLHTAIKLGEFRYEETLNNCSRFINVPNKAGKTPLDVCQELLDKTNTEPVNVGKDLRLTMQYLLGYGAVANHTIVDKEQSASYQFQSVYFERIKHIITYQQLKEVIRDVGEDHSFCLKFKKKMVIECIKRFSTRHANHPHLGQFLVQLKRDVNNEIAEYKYLRQLRSHLWLIRQIRGLYGWTSTQGEINTLIGHYLDKPNRECGSKTLDESKQHSIIWVSTVSC